MTGKLNELYEKTTLPNGLRVITGAMPYTRSAAVQFYLGVGARVEPREISGISHFVEHMVFKGTRRRPDPIAISEAIEGVGGSMNAATDHEHTNYRALVPSNHLDTALDVITDMLRSSTFAPSDIRKERAVIIEEINSTYDAPAEIVDLAFDGLLWGNHPLGRDVAGTRQSVRHISREDLVRHVQNNYRPDRIVLSVAGNVSNADVVRLADQLWGDMPGREQQALGGLAEQVPPAIEMGPRVKLYIKETEQTNLIVGVPAVPYTHPDRYTQDVLDALLGGGMSSRLFGHIREQLGLAYSVSSFVRTYPDAGAFGVHAAVDNDNVVPTLAAIVTELDRIRQSPAPESELRKVKEYIKGHTLLSLERSGYVAHWAGWQELMLGKIESVDEALEKIESITPEEVLDLARRLFSTEKLHLAVVGPVRRSSAYRRVLALN